MGKDIYNTYIWGENVALRIYFANQEGKRQITQKKKRNDGSSTAQNGQQMHENMYGKDSGKDSGNNIFYSTCPSYSVTLTVLPIRGGDYAPFP